MAQYLDSQGLRKYDELIKTYISTNGGKIDLINIKHYSGNQIVAEPLDISSSKAVTIDLTRYMTGLELGGITILPSNGKMVINKDDITTLLGAASSTANGYMSKTDKANLDTLVDLLGTESGDSDTVVNTIREVLAIFNQYGEGTTIANALANKADTSAVYDKTTADDTFVKNTNLNDLLADFMSNNNVAQMDDITNALATYVQTTALTNTLKSYVPTTRKVNGRALSADVNGVYGATWASGTVYYKGDIIKYNNNLYVCMDNGITSTLTPDTDIIWQQLGTLADATTSVKGLMTTTQVSKLNGIEASATADSAIDESTITGLFS